MQWTCIYNELTDELNNKMYELSLGNLDIAHRIYREAQRLVILADSDDERINTSVLEQAYVRACGLSAGTDEIKSYDQKCLYQKGIEGKKYVDHSVYPIILGNLLQILLGLSIPSSS